jgi:hypothetical protein
MNLSEKQKQLSNQPRPRAVRMSKRGRLWTFLLGGVLAVIELGLVAHLYFGWARSASLNGVLTRSGFTFYLVLLLPLLPFPFYRGLLKQRELLRNGEVAVATITSTSGPSSTPSS